MKFPVLPFIFLFCFAFCKAQLFEGVVKDAGTNENLQYVNIGIVNKNTGTVSDANGKFQLFLDPKYDTATLKISMIGYQSISYSLADFKKQFRSGAILYLDKTVAELKEIVIKNKNLKTYTLGNTIGKKFVTAGFANNVLGNEIGMIVRIKSKPTFIEAFTAQIAYNKYEKLKFRINFYSLKNGLPDTSLLTENIIVTSMITKGAMTIDLSNYNIMVNEDFFVALEWIEGLGEGGLHFLADYKGTPAITRAASQGQWNKQDDLSFAFTVTVKY